MNIIRRKVPQIGDKLADDLVAFVQKLRASDLFKSPGVAESLDWAQALMQLDAVELSPELIDGTLGVLLKYQDDIARIEGSEVKRLLDEINAEKRGA